MSVRRRVVKRIGVYFSIQFVLRCDWRLPRLSVKEVCVYMCELKYVCRCVSSTRTVV